MAENELSWHHRIVDIYSLYLTMIYIGFYRGVPLNEVYN